MSLVKTDRTERTFGVIRFERASFHFWALLLLCVCFGSVAKADRALTLYGVIDMGIAFQQATDSSTRYFSGGTNFGLINGGQTTSYFGLAGQENLGRGIELNFVLEDAFNAGNGGPTGGNRIFNRQAWLGMQSAELGYLRIGRQFNFARDYLNPLTPFSGGDFTRAAAGSNFASGGTERLSNTIKFETTDLSGFKFGIGYSFSAQISSVYRNYLDTFEGGYQTEDGRTSQYNYQMADNLRALTGGLKYAKGPLYLTLTSDVFFPNASTANQEYSPISSRTIGALYDFEILKVAAAFGQIRNGWINGLQPIIGPNQTVSFNNLNNSMIFDENVSINSYLLALTSATRSDNEFFGAWRMVSPSSSMRQNATIPVSTQNSLSLGWTHKLTKQTNLYAYSSYTTNYATIDGVNSFAVGFGLRHKF